VKNYYHILGLDKSANAEQIKQAFRRLASQHHPDKGGDTGKFQEVQEAYAVLSDTAKRAEYDNPRPQFSGFPGAGGAHFNMNDIFGQMFGQQFGQPQHQPRRNHVRMTVWINLHDVAQGGSRMVNVSTSAGSSTVQIEIPQAIEDGDNVQYSGVAPGAMDLVVQFRVHPDSKWRRDSLNIHYDHHVSVWDMILGAEVEVQHFLGHRLVIKIPPATQPGTVMRLRGHGIADRQGKKGDLMVRMHAQIPKNIASEIVAAIQQYRT
jgi:DnaJ-class molecular chaperone